MKTIISLIRTLVIVFVFLFISHLLNAQDIDPSPGQTNFLNWLQENWAVILLAVSEILALLPGAQSGIMKIILNLIRKLIGTLADKKSS